ncbi:hypothetical protein H310_12603 [Aphanomyces invadans]|uniref:Uncharacterized protein n=1 Tax=Aphanomyces invadans TaxID=157072 RepID=A0A024TGN8_9STRA|nr:hypothetical protein H310_12603 [Aphanomyces invadans]ETV93315.1 hypothetical protein H310_12603 [Aphanomyces invadans]|eukprot:XP_008877951.1 hypothetical protein H310_12603 [Aphanomyces invadans]
MANAPISTIFGITIARRTAPAAFREAQNLAMSMGLPHSRRGQRRTNLLDFQPRSSGKGPPRLPPQAHGGSGGGEGDVARSWWGFYRSHSLPVPLPSKSPRTHFRRSTDKQNQRVGDRSSTTSFLSSITFRLVWDRFVAQWRKEGSALRPEASRVHAV